MTRAALAALAITLCACSDWDSLSTGRDGGGPMLPAYCSSGVRDGDETDVDCGGACLPCDVNRTCALTKDCQTRTCVEGRCSLTSTPPGWLDVGELATLQTGTTVSTSPDGNIYVLGGDPGTGMPRPLFSYDPDTAQWRTLAPLDGDLGLATTFGPGGRLYALGKYPYLTDVRAYDPATDSWSADVPLSTSRGHFTAAGDDTHAYVIGGYVPVTLNDTLVMDTIEVYSRDPMPHFTSKPLPQAWRGGSESAVILDGLVYAFPSTGTLGIYDPSLDTWRAGAAPTKRMTYLHAVVGADRRIYSIEGAEAYDQQAWTSVAALPAPAFSGARGRDGRIYALASAPQGFHARLFAYGPALVLPTRSASAGGSLLVGGSNFAIRAVVSFRWDDDATVVASAESDDNGLLVPLTVPVAPGPGLHRLRVIDDRSRYPVSVAITIQ